MRVLVAFTYCDICNGDSNIRTEADESLAIRFMMGGKAKRLDLCTEHKDPAWSAIIDNAIDDLDASVSTPTEKTLACPVCGELASRTQRGMAMHISRMHPESRVQCGECGRNGFKSEHGLLMHRVRAHGYQKGAPHG